ncbi:MAG: CRISPR system precrRNA processing endoribonuclease RAMP protein Cas6 [Candidatus Bathyarchaeia archaeon]
MAITVFDFECLAKSDVLLSKGSYLGFPLRDVIYQAIYKVDPACFMEIHRGGAIAPFSTLPPLGVRGGKIAFLKSYISASSLFRFEVRCLNDKFTEIFAKAMLNEKYIRLANGVIEVLSVRARTVPSEVLVREAEKSVECRKFAILFKTPTVLRLKVEGENRASLLFPLPDPRLIFINLYIIWNRYMEPKIDEGYIAWLSKMGICPAGLKNVRTYRLFEYKEGGKRRFDIGFVGTVRLAFVDTFYEKSKALQTHTLLKFAEYSNIGKGRTAGLGVIKVLKPPQ